MSILTDTTMKSLENSLDLRLRRQELLASNLANIDTPGYQPHDLEFEGFLRRATEVPEPESVGGVAIDRTSPMHMSPADMRMDEMPLDSTITRADVENSLDGNGVDLDKEVARSAENSVRYSASSEMTRRKIAILNYAISSVR
jgi:flagellar basal-body rod protein FlgB